MKDKKSADRQFSIGIGRHKILRAGLKFILFIFLVDIFLLWDMFNLQKKDTEGKLKWFAIEVDKEEDMAALAASSYRHLEGQIWCSSFQTVKILNLIVERSWAFQILVIACSHTISDSKILFISFEKSFPKYCLFLWL